jgi:hypothetical protein
VKSLLKVNQWNIEQSSCGISSFLWKRFLSVLVLALGVFRTLH